MPFPNRIAPPRFIWCPTVVVPFPHSLLHDWVIHWLMMVCVVIENSHRLFDSFFLLWGVVPNVSDCILALHIITPVSTILSDGKPNYGKAVLAFSQSPKSICSIHPRNWWRTGQCEVIVTSIFETPCYELHCHAFYHEPRPCALPYCNIIH